MSSHSILLEINPQLGLLNDIYQDETNLYRDTQLSKSLLIAATEMFQSVADKSLFSLDIELQNCIHELRAEVTPDRFNFMHGMNLDGVNHALDISEDLGGMAHFLAERVNHLDAVKVDTERARISKLRCAGKANICHISEDFDKLQIPQAHYDLIVLGAFEAIGITRQERIAFLSRLQAALTERGVLLINVKNRERIARWFSAPYPQTSGTVPFRDLYNTNYEQEFDRKELLDTLAAANFPAINLSASFSTGDAYQNLFSEDYLTSNLNAVNHFYRLGAFENAQLNEFLFFKNLFNEKQRVFDYASRFLAVVGSSNLHTRRVYDNDFAHFAGTGRKPQWRTVTTRACAAAEVFKNPMYPAVIPDSGHSAGLVTQNLAPQPFHKGRLLIGDWLASATAGDDTALHEMVDEYFGWLQALAARENFSSVAYDLLPFNVVASERGGKSEFHGIDPEWQIDAEFGAEFLLFRALFYFAFENKACLCGFAERTDLASIGMFVLQYMPGTMQMEDLQQFAELEERIQAEISNNFHTKSVQHALWQSFESPPLVQELQPRCQVLWGNDAGVMDEQHRVVVDWPETPTGSGKISMGLPLFNPAMPVLRIDPVIRRGLFSFDSLEIFDKDANSILRLASADAICAAAEVQNVEPVASDDGLISFVALSDGPHFLFDFSKLENIENADRLELSLALRDDANHNIALASLTRAINEQNIALLQQADSLNQHRSDKEYFKVVITDLITQKERLNEKLKEEIHDNRIQQHEDKQNIKQLNQLLQQQHEQFLAQLQRNRDLEDFLMARPITRVKRFVARLLGRRVDDVVEPTVDAVVPTVIEEIEADPNAFPTSGELLGQNTEDYQLWLSQNSPDENDIETAKREIEGFKLKPVFSILVPIYNTDPDYLIPMIRSVQNQIYPYWQLCLVDDASPKDYLKPILEFEAAQDERIVIQLNEKNQGIALTTNDALVLATGDYVGLLDHDDELSIDALYENAKAINRFPDVGLIYSDEDKMDMQGNRIEPFFKPDYSPDLLDTNNYVCHFTVINKQVVDEIGGFREGLDGSQDHDIILRAIEQSKRVIHIPKILYHWRKIPGSTAVAYDSKSYAWEAGRKAVENRLQKNERGVRVEFGSLKGTYRVRREIRGEPLVSIIIPFKDKPELLDSCLNSILNRSTYRNFEIVGVSNSSEQPLTFERMEYYRQADPRVRFVEKNIPFNFSAICNYGVAQAKGEYVLLLNNDIEIRSPDWIERLLEHAQRPEIGAVGGKLLFPDGRIQHAGVVAGMVGAAGHPHKFFPDNHIGYHGRLHMVFNVSAVTGAMLMVKTEKFREVGGLDETNLAIAYNDIDFCLKLLDQGYLNVFTPYCTAIHHESVSRGYEDTPEKLQRLKDEQGHFLGKWQEFLAAGDPYYNTNLSLKNERFSLNFRE